MNHTIKGGSAFATLRVELDRGEWIKAEKNAMLAMSGDISLSARMDGGFLRGIARKFSGESFFFQELRAGNTGGWAMLAPPMPGAITAIDMYGKTGITAEKGAFLAATDGIEISSTVQRPIKAMFGGEGFVVVKITGTGTVFLSGFGAIEPLILRSDEEITVDNTHLLAWENSVEYTIGKGGKSWTSAVLAGEGLVAKLRGPGRVWVQTRTLGAFRSWLGDLSMDDKSGK